MFPIGDENLPGRGLAWVTLGLIVGTDGRPSNIRVLNSLGMGLDEKAMEAVRNWKFEPAMKDGRPASTWVTAEFAFRLADSSIFRP